MESGEQMRWKDAMTAVAWSSDYFWPAMDCLTTEDGPFWDYDPPRSDQVPEQWVVTPATSGLVLIWKRPVCLTRIRELSILRADSPPVACRPRYFPFLGAAGAWISCRVGGDSNSLGWSYLMSASRVGRCVSRGGVVSAVPEGGVQQVQSRR